MADDNPILAPPDAAAVTPPVVEEVEPKVEAPAATPPSFSVTETETPHSAASTEPKQQEFVPEPAVKDPVIESEKPTNPIESKKVPQSLISFREESNIIADLSELEKKALDELKQLVKEALDKNEFISPPPPPATAAEVSEPSSNTPPPASELKTHVAESQIVKESAAPPTEISSLPGEISIWGVPFFKDDRTDVILLKFLRARDFKVKDAFIMLKNTMIWRKEFGIDALIDENLGDHLEKVVFMDGYDKEGHPVCYNVYGEFQNKELYLKTFADEEKRSKFLRWRIQFLERSIRKLDFSPGGISTIFQVSDLKNSPGPAKKELRLATRQALQLLQDNYPEFVAKQVFINVPWWYLAFYTVINPFLTQRTKSKFVFASPAKTAETLFKYIRPEHVPIQYGGLSLDHCDCDPEFTIDDPVAEITIKPATKQTVEIVVNERCFLVWELRVVGWEVSYSSEYVPNTEGGYTIIIQKTRKMTPTDEPVVSSSFKITELGKILLTVDNPTSKKKKLLYRFKVVPLSE